MTFANLEMFPLDMEEFFFALGLNPNVWEKVKSSFRQKAPIEEFIHEKMMELFRLYLIVGGMPAVVQKYIDTNNLLEVLAEQQAIIRLVFSNDNLSQSDHVLYLPIYMAAFMEKPSLPPLTYSVDLSGLK